MLVMAVIDESVDRRHDPRRLRAATSAFGGPEQIAEQIKTKVLDAGVDGVDPQPCRRADRLPPGGHHGGRPRS